MERVLRASAVTLYARPWQDPKALHIIAATAPLKRDASQGLITLDPGDGPVQTLLPCSHHVGETGDRRSFAGVLASVPGITLRRNSDRESGARIEGQGFPRWPSRDHSEDVTPSIAYDASNDRRFLGCSLPNEQRSDRGSVAVALAVRPGDRPPFKAWDELAIVAILDAAAPMVRSWRDWAAARLEVVEDIVKSCGIAAGRIEATIAKETSNISSNLQLGLKRSIWVKMVLDQLEKQDTVQHRVHDPIPRSESLESFTRHIATTAYELVYQKFQSWSAVYRVTVLAEVRHGSDSDVRPLACHHAFDEQPIPEAGATDDPRILPGPIANGGWRGFFDEGRTRVFSCDGKTGMIIPFHAWVGGQALRGALSLELKGEDRDLRGIQDDLMILARRLAAGWTVSGASIHRGKFAAKNQAESFAERIRDHVNADQVLLVIDAAYGSSGGSQKRDVQRDDDHDWCIPTIGFTRPDRCREVAPDPSCHLWGIEQSVGDGEVSLRIPIRRGTDQVGYIIAKWNGVAWRAFLDDPHAVRNNWVHSILAAWSLWSWSEAWSLWSCSLTKVLSITCRARNGQVVHLDPAEPELQGICPTVANLIGAEPISQDSRRDAACLVEAELDHLGESPTIDNLIGADTRNSNPAHAA